MHQNTPIDFLDTNDSFQILHKNTNLEFLFPLIHFQRYVPLQCRVKIKIEGIDITMYLSLIYGQMLLLNELFLKKYIFPCNFIYKCVKVSRDCYKSEKCIVFEAHYKDFGLELGGWADSKLK